MFSKYKEKRNYRFFKQMSYYDSLDYELSLLLKQYGIDFHNAIIWYYNKEKNCLLFQKNHKYYQATNGEITEISEKEIWKKSR